MSGPRSLLWIPEKARSLAAAGATQGRAWSLGQACEHLALAFEATLRDVERPIPSERRGVWRRARCFVMKRALLLTGRFPSGVPAPDLVVPSAWPDLEPTLDRLEAAVKDFARASDRQSIGWPDHPVLGSMSGQDWRRFHAIHAAHHFSFFRTPAAIAPRPRVKGGIA